MLFIWVGTFHWPLGHGLTKWTWYMNYLNEPTMDYPKCKPLKFLTQKFKNQFACSCSNLLGTIFKRHRFCMHCMPFISFLVEFHQDRGIEWRGILYCTHPVFLQPPTTYFPCILQRFWHTLSHVRIYSSQKQNIVIPEMTSEDNSSHSPLFLGGENGKEQIYKLWKLIQN